MVLGGRKLIISSAVFHDKIKVAGAEIKWYVLLLKYLSVSVSVLGYLALTWSTVVLLGGFVTVMPRKDFLYITLLSLVQALRVFNAFNDAKFLRFIWVLRTPILVMIYIIKRHKGFTGMVRSRFSDGIVRKPFLLNLIKASVIAILAAGFLMVSCVLLIVSSLIVFGLSACLVVPFIRLLKQDYGDNDGNSSQSNLKTALNIFYSLTLCQGLLYCVWYFPLDGQKVVVVLVSKRWRFGKWGYESAWGYLKQVREKCEKDPSTTHGYSLISYAIDLLESESPDNYLSGARMVDAFFTQGIDIAPLFRCSRYKIQRLLATLGWRSPADREIRGLAARILANLASDLHLCELPGAIKLISSLLESPEENYDKEVTVSSLKGSQQEDNQRRDRGSLVIKVTEKLLRNRYQVNDQAYTKTVRTDLIVQGLLILERLAHDEHNCREICNTDGLLSKITGPLYSETLVDDIFREQEVHDDVKYDAWINMVNGSMKVLSRLIHFPVKPSQRLRYEISCNNVAVSNMEMILEDAHHLPQLQTRAIELLSELALDTSTDIRKESFVTRLVRIFLEDQSGNGRDGNATVLRQRAGDALALLCMRNQSNTKLIFGLQDHGNYIITRITQILDSKDSTVYKISAAEILEHLCVNNDVDKIYVAKTLLPMALRELLHAISEGDTQAETGADSNTLPSTQNDEENQHLAANGQCRSPQTKEKESDKTKLQAALLSLVAMICTNLIRAEVFADAVQQVIPEHCQSGFLGMLNEMVERNSHSTPDCLRILKLTAEMVIWMFEHNSKSNSNSKIFNRQQADKIINTMFKISEIMSDLESCLLFKATDDIHKMKKLLIMPFSSTLVKRAQELLPKELS